MVTFEALELNDGSPIYLQIVGHIKRKIVAREIENGDDMPSRRTVSALLGINPNTIQKAYKLLEEENLIKSHGGAKSVITIDDMTVQGLKQELLREHVESVLATMFAMGIEKEEAIALFMKLWEENYEE